MSVLKYFKTLLGIQFYEAITEPFRHPRGWLLYKYVQLFPNLIIRKSNQKSRAKNTIVSLTTYGARKEQVQWTILSILNGTLLPEQIHLYVCKELQPFFLEKQYLLQKTISAGLLVIHSVEEDLKSYKKLYYALSAYPQANIVTADDDLIYYRKWLYSLFNAYQKAPQYIWASRCHGILYNPDKSLKPYQQWQWENTNPNVPSVDIFPTSGSGILFPPNVFSELVFQKEIFLSLCPTADDVWWWFCLNVNNAKIRGLQEDGLPFKAVYYEPRYKKSNEALHIINVTRGGNDQQIVALQNWLNNQK